MKTQIRCFFVLAIMFWTWSLNAQGGSYQWSISGPSNWRVDDVMVNEQDEMLALIRPLDCGDCNELFLVPFDASGTKKGMRFKTNWYPLESSQLKAEFLGDRVILGYPNILQGYMFSYDRNLAVFSASAFYKPISFSSIYGLHLRTFVQIPTFNTLAITSFADHTDIVFTNEGTFFLFFLDALSNPIWKSNFKYYLPGEDIIAPSVTEAAWDESSGNYFLTSKVFTDSARVKYKQVLFKLDTLGRPVSWKSIEGGDFEKIFVKNGSLFLLGKTEQPLPFSANHSNAVLAKFDTDLNLVWARAYSGERFEYARASLNFSPNGSMILGVSTTGAFPTVLINLDQQGRATGQTGYPLFEPRIEVLSDGSLLMATDLHFDSTGHLSRKAIFAKTDKNGLIDGCEQFPACIGDGEIKLTFGSFDVQPTMDSTFVWHLPVDSSGILLQSEPFCDIPAPPSPDFHLPESACLGDSLRTQNTKNVLATAREWSILINGKEAIVKDSLNIGIRFAEPGVYKIAQRVFFLGCDYESQRTVNVLPPLDAHIFIDSTRCDTTHAELKVASNRPVLSYFWGNNAQTASILANLSEKHAVTVSDGICSASDSILVEKIKPSPDFCFAKIAFPNVFSPNSDGLNDEFFPQGVDFEPIKLTIFDRWGNIWHESADPIWRPTKIQPAVFTYKFEFRDLFSGEKKVATGSVSAVW